MPSWHGSHLVCGLRAPPQRHEKAKKRETPQTKATKRGTHTPEKSKKKKKDCGLPRLDLPSAGLLSGPSGPAGPVGPQQASVKVFRPNKQIETNSVRNIDDERDSPTKFAVSWEPVVFHNEQCSVFVRENSRTMNFGTYLPIVDPRANLAISTRSELLVEVSPSPARPRTGSVLIVLVVGVLSCAASCGVWC